MRRVARGRVVVAAVALAVLAGLGATPARADGDPASDVLIAERVFLVLDTATMPPYLRELYNLTAEAEHRGIAIRVAVIARSTDLGSVPELFGRAQQYATFLGQELRIGYHGTLVVVMAGKPGGVGLFGRHASAQARASVTGLSVPETGSPEVLSRIASTAIRNVAAASGVHLTTPRAAVASGSSHTLVFVIGGVVAACAAALGGAALMRRPRS
jgi:hypothetical protein